MTRHYYREGDSWSRYQSQHDRHHERFKRYVSAHGLLCQACCGHGGHTEPVLDDGSGPFEPCGWCEGTGLVTRWLRGLWLRSTREERRSLANLR